MLIHSLLLSEKFVLLTNFVKITAIGQLFSNMDSDWLVAVLPADQKSC